MYLFLIALAAAVVEPAPRPMSVEIVRDPITDHVRAYATVRERRHRLVVSCDSDEAGRPEVSFHSDRWLSRGNVFTGYRRIVHRFDGRRPWRQMWRVERRHGTLTGERRIASFIANLMAADQLTIRTRDIENHRLDLTYRLVDVAPAIEQAMSACAGRAWTAAELAR